VATSPVDICNKALLRVGHRQLLGDLSENTAEAQACNALYDMALDEVLAAAPWRWAMQHATLALLSGVTRTNWAYAYALPADCLTPRYLVPAGLTPPTLPPLGPWTFPSNSWVDGGPSLALGVRVPFEMGYDATFGRILVSNAEAAELVYTARVTAVPYFPPLFTDALAWKLASDLALSLPVKPQVGLAMAQQYERALSAAVVSDANQGQANAPADAEHIRVR
jgi:hypothetical protein